VPLAPMFLKLMIFVGLGLLTYALLLLADVQPAIRHHKEDSQRFGRYTSIGSQSLILCSFPMTARSREPHVKAEIRELTRFCRGSVSLEFDFTFLAVVSALGALGGLLHALVFGQNRLRLPRRIVKTKSFDLSFIGDILVGVGAAVAVLYTISPNDFARLVSLSIFAGFSGGSVLGSYGAKAELQVEREKSRSLAEIVRR
jgi:hypothetical protein